MKTIMMIHRDAVITLEPDTFNGTPTYFSRQLRQYYVSKQHEAGIKNGEKFIPNPSSKESR